jgi:alpha-glucosidase
MLWLYRQALRLRRAEGGLGDGPFAWLDAPEGVLAFSRGDRFVCVTNLSGGPVALPENTAILLSSRPLDAGLLPPDSTAWLRTRPAAAVQSPTRTTRTTRATRTTR